MNNFLERYKGWGHDINLSNIIPQKSIRVNTLKISSTEFEKRFSSKFNLSKILFTEFGYWVKTKLSLASTPEYLNGLFYIQEAASMLPVQVLSPKRNETVLDMCAAPGSKTTQIAQYMQDAGVIIALDSKKQRLSALKNNLERCGISNTLTYNIDAANAANLGMKFDKILLDAPCSGNFVTDLNWFEKRSLSGIKNNVKKQKRLLESAIPLLKPQGTLVYSTCSLEREENEEVIEYILNKFSLKLLPISLKIGSSGLTPSTSNCRRFWPDISGTQGFFIAKLGLK